MLFYIICLLSKILFLWVSLPVAKMRSELPFTAPITQKHYWWEMKRGTPKWELCAPVLPRRSQKKLIEKQIVVYLVPVKKRWVSSRARSLQRLISKEVKVGGAAWIWSGNVSCKNEGSSGFIFTIRYFL